MAERRRGSAKGSESNSPIEKTPTDWELVETLLGAEEMRTMFLYGDPSLGKTYAAYHFGREGEEIYAITLTEDTPAAELRGHYVPVEGRLEWRDGPFTAAMRGGHRLVINEITHGPPEAHSLLYPVLESMETARLTLPTNETIRPAPGFQVVVTDNLTPDELPEALQDRFQCTIEITEPHPNAFDALPEDLRQAARRSYALEPSRRVTIRRWLAIDRLRPVVGLHKACQAVLGTERGDQIIAALNLGKA